MLLAEPVLADAVVVQASGPDAGRYKVGTKLSHGAKISLRSASTLTLLDRAGSWQLRGPLVSSVGRRTAESSAKLAAVQNLIGERKRIKKLAAVASVDSVIVGVTRNSFAGQARTGAVRGTSRLADDQAAWWQIPTNQSGTFCIVRGEPVELVRMGSGRQSSATLKDLGSADTYEYLFPADSIVAKAVGIHERPIADGRLFDLAELGAVTSKVRLLTIRPQRNAVALAKALAKRGCFEQLDALAAEMR